MVAIDMMSSPLGDPVCSLGGEMQLTDLEPCLNHTHLNQAWSWSVSELNVVYYLSRWGKNS